MIPIFLFVMVNGDIWTSVSRDFTPSGTVAAIYRINGAVHSQKLGTISGNNPTYACSGGTSNRHESANEKV
jgi:hypothetical protein